MINFNVSLTTWLGKLIGRLYNFYNFHSTVTMLNEGWERIIKSNSKGNTDSASLTRPRLHVSDIFVSNACKTASYIYMRFILYAKCLCKSLKRRHYDLPLVCQPIGKPRFQSHHPPTIEFPFIFRDEYLSSYEIALNVWPGIFNIRRFARFFEITMNSSA